MRIVLLSLLVCTSCAKPPDVSADRVAVAKVLDDFHDAAAKADESRYFAHFAADGVFLGTAAEERWDVTSFRKYVHPYFSQGRGWTYVPRARSIAFAPDVTVAWFDEMLDNEKYGQLRGTGVLRKIAGTWKIAQYNLTFTIPNEASSDVVDAVRRAAQKAP